MLPSSIDGVVEVEVLRGAEADPLAPCALLVEVPHGADRRHHYDDLRGRLVGDLPADLHVFFHMNTDVGAWAYGKAVAERVVRDDPTKSALLLRCQIPRTFVDCNRPAEFRGEGDVAKGGVTAGLHDYVRHEADRRLLLDLHRRYVQAAEEAYAAVCGTGGLALVPHTYGPRTLGIEAVDDTIVEQLHWAHEPQRYETWPVRAELDLLTRDGEGTLWAPEGLEEDLLAAFASAGYSPRANDTYYLHPATLGHRWCVQYPGQLVCLEVRRDLLVGEWRYAEEMLALPQAVERIADVLAPAVGARLS
jgi:hypothetical protein